MNNFKTLTSSILIVIIGMLPACDRRHDVGKIAIQPLGQVNRSYVDSVRITLIKEYGAVVTILPPQRIPDRFITRVKNERYRADSIIHFLMIQRPDSVDTIIGITEFDISTTKADMSGKVKEPASRYSDWGVMGLAYTPGTSCIVSTYRIKEAVPAKVLARLKKIALHEIGHTTGLPHCTNTDCVMRDAAETVKTIDEVKPSLCIACKERAGY